MTVLGAGTFVKELADLSFLKARSGLMENPGLSSQNFSLFSPTPFISSATFKT